MAKNDMLSIWGAFKKDLVKTAYAISSRMFRIVDIDPREGKLGYTSEGCEIHLAYEHPITKKLDFQHKYFFIKGVFAHELMHQLNTNFTEMIKVGSKLPRFEKRIFMDIFNIMEDTAIEYWASDFFGGYLLRALKYSIMYIFKNAIPLGSNPRETPFTQFLNAYIQYGDGGTLVGDFTFPEAREYFYKALPYFDKTIKEPDGKKRVHYAYEVFELTRPLWIEEVKNEEAFEAFMELRRSLFEGLGKTMDDSGGLPIAPCPEARDDESPSVKEKRRERIRQAEEKCSDSQEDEDDIIDKNEYTISDEDIENIKRDIANCKSEEAAEKEEVEAAEKIEDFSKELNLHYKGITCNNIVVKGDTAKLEPEYQRILEPMQGGINQLVNQLKRVFRNDTENKEYRSSGKINIKRLSAGRKTARVFDRKIGPKNKSYVAVELVVDISGSMGGKRIKLAREAVIGLAEVFDKLKIPTKVLAFTADMGGYKAVHYHYLNWHNSRSERRKLLNLTAMNNNFDGYSIRYAGKELSRRPEEHKIMIVISDGAPACRYYNSFTQGISDTSNAIRETSKYTTVIGVAIGGDVETLYQMYGQNFIHIKNIDELFNQLGQKIRKEIMSW